MEIKDVEKIDRIKGTASTVKADDLIPQYTEGVERFLRDNSSLGDEWVKTAGERLYNFQVKNKEGDVIGSSTDMGVAIATFTDIPLITGQQLLRLYSDEGNKNPFENVYIDFGAQINGKPNVNSNQAKILLTDFEKRKISLENGRVPNFSQLKLVADKDAGLAYKLSDDVTSDNVALVSEYPFVNVGKNGLFGACLNWCGYWGAGVDFLANSYDIGRVVRYDAEGVSPKKLVRPEKSDLVKTLTETFRKKF